MEEEAERKTHRHISAIFFQALKFLSAYWKFITSLLHD